MVSENKKERKLILFGAGKRGREAFRHFGPDKVIYFCDNDALKHDTDIEGIKVISFEEMKHIYSDDIVVMITLENPGFLIEQLERNGINDYLLFREGMDILPKYGGKETSLQKKHNDVLRNFVKRCAVMDLLEDVSGFMVLVKEALGWGENLNYMTPGREEEGFRYGNISVLGRYADEQITIGKYMPIVSHMDCMPFINLEHQYKTAVMISGDYFVERIHKRAPWVPVFTVGPFINYAKRVYNRELFVKLKKRIGTMLLAFLPHTLEGVKRKINNEFFIRKLRENYGKKYKTIWLCVYFNDLQDDVCLYAKNNDIHLVTAGFRFDQRFDDRLKTMIELSDAIVCGDIGTFIGYGLFYNKPVARIEVPGIDSSMDVQFGNREEKELLKYKDSVEFEQKFGRLFDDVPSIHEDKKNWMEPFAGFNNTRSRDYIKNAFEISEDIYKKYSMGKLDYPNAVRKTYLDYYSNKDIEKMYMLKQAVGSFLD